MFQTTNQHISLPKYKAFLHTSGSHADKAQKTYQNPKTW